jgi:hypothetical protein
VFGLKYLFGHNCATSVLQRLTSEADVEGPLPRNFPQARFLSVLIRPAS